MRTHSISRNAAFLLAIAIAALVLAVSVSDRGTLVLGGREAQAIVGRPLTPMSYAGVARRTTRRAVYAGAATSGYYGGGYYAAPVTTGVVYSLPSGCASNGDVYACGGVSYRAYYDGPTVVYRPM